MKTKKRTINEYTDLDLPCELCGRRFKTAQGLYGHKRWVHGAAAPEGPLPVAPAASPGGSPEGPLPSAPTASPGPATRADSLGHGSSVKELKAEVEALRLQLQRRKLQSEFPLPPARPTDVMQQSGLGEIDAEVKSQAQRRAFALPDEAAPRAGIDWLSLLNSPNLPAILQLLRGGLGGSDSGSGLGILKELGINLKDLLAQSSAPKAGEGFSIGGLNLAGSSLTPELLKSILEYKATEERTKSDFEGRKAMGDSLTQLVELLGPLIAGNGPSPGRAAGIGAGPRIREPKRLGIECERCGHLNEVPVDQAPGGVIHCGGTIDGEPCSASWVATDPAEDRKRRPEITKVQAEELPKSVPCGSCGQMLKSEGQGLGTEVTCPICHQVQTLWSPEIPLEPEEPGTPEQKRAETLPFRESRGFGQGA